MSKIPERDVRSEIKIALFWRHLIGDFEYVKFSPDDMLRWYDALELRGPLEIRQLLSDRYTTRPASTIQGIVAVAPHPPSWLVRDWLAHHEMKVRTGGLWVAAGAFVLSSFVTFPLLYRCSTLTPLSPFVMNPPISQPSLAAPQMPVGSTYEPNNTVPPSTVQPSMAAQPGATSPHSGGIAGAASGAAPPGGATGPANVGASSGTTSSPGVGGQQP
jgi:hypothetical protein